MGNIISDTSLMADKQKINELTFDNEALKKQVNSLKQVIQKEGKIIGKLEHELKELKKLKEEEKNNDCVICNYFKKQ